MSEVSIAEEGQILICIYRSVGCVLYGTPYIRTSWVILYTFCNFIVDLQVLHSSCRRCRNDTNLCVMDKRNMKAAAADSSTSAYTHEGTHYIVITSNTSFNLIYCYQIPTTNNSCRKRNADIMTHTHIQPSDTHSLQPPTIQANSTNTSEYLTTYAGSASCKQ